MLFYLVGCILFVAQGVLMVTDPSPAQPNTHFLGWNGIVFFGLGIPVLAYRLTRSRPRLIISDMGIEDCANGLGLIPWSEISAIEYFTHQRVPLLSLSMHTPDNWIPKLRIDQRWLAPFARLLGGSDINIPLSGLTEKPTEVYRQVTEYFKS